jgi:hypothetical protein
MSKVERRNLYWGVNAHLNSYLQDEPGEWTMFHTAHIGDVARILDRVLPDGYEVGLERSLQIRETHPDTGEPIRPRRTQPRPDVSIYQLAGSARQPISTPLTAEPTLTLAAIDTMQLDEDYEEQLYLRAVVVREITVRGGRVPVTRIELLSPTNKRPGRGYVEYFRKRNATLEARMPLIEIDYLHESEPVPARVPSYPDAELDAHPYTAYVTDTRLSVQQGITVAYGFDVDTPIPVIRVPLAGSDAIGLPLDDAYQQTFTSLRAFSNVVNYAELPMNFERYSPADQDRIRAVMQRAAEGGLSDFS